MGAIGYAVYVNVQQHAGLNVETGIVDNGQVTHIFSALTIPLNVFQVNGVTISGTQAIFSMPSLSLNPNVAGTLLQVHFTITNTWRSSQTWQAGTEATHDESGGIFPQTLATESFKLPQGTCGSCIYPANALNSVSTWSGHLTANQNNIIGLYYRDRTTPYDTNSAYPLYGWVQSGYTMRNMVFDFPAASFSQFGVGTATCTITWTLVSIVWQPDGSASALTFTPSGVVSFTSTFNIVISSDASITATLTGTTSHT
jgi:hypothetical protein